LGRENGGVGEGLICNTTWILAGLGLSAQSFSLIEHFGLHVSFAHLNFIGFDISICYATKSLLLSDTIFPN